MSTSSPTEAAAGRLVAFFHEHLASAACTLIDLPYYSDFAPPSHDTPNFSSCWEFHPAVKISMQRELDLVMIIYGVARVRGLRIPKQDLITRAYRFLHYGLGSWMDIPTLAKDVKKSAETLALNLPEWWYFDQNFQVYDTADAFVRYVNTAIEEEPGLAGLDDWLLAVRNYSTRLDESRALARAISVAVQARRNPLGHELGWHTVR
ncbi:hypothetical protein OF83DRAFT_1180607 [Amylostereum chailletii]|nr:hypothetical protein OF83DRAFT_1180607 [Amylostereum chailletii]